MLNLKGGSLICAVVRGMCSFLRSPVHSRSIHRDRFAFAFIIDTKKHPQLHFLSVSNTFREPPSVSPVLPVVRVSKAISITDRGGRQNEMLRIPHCSYDSRTRFSCGMLRRLALVRTEVSEELSASFIRVTRLGELGTTLAVTSNRRTLRRNTKPHAVTSQKTHFFIVTAVKISDLTSFTSSGLEAATFRLVAQCLNHEFGIC
jgi:hypothetical protein